MSVQQTSKEYFRSLYILHIALMTGVLLFSILSVFLVSSGSMAKNDTGLDAIFIKVVPALVLIALIIAVWSYNKRLARLKGMRELKQKLTGYRSVFIIRTAWVEGSGIFAIMAYLLTGNYLYIGIAGLLVLLFLIWVPTREKVANALDLSTQERSIVSDPNAIVAEIEQR